MLNRRRGNVIDRIQRFWFIHGFDIDGHRHRMSAASDEDSIDRADVAIIASPRNRDVVQIREAIVCRIDVHPA